MKNHVLPNLYLLKSCIIILATASLISCGKEDDEAPTTPTPQDVSYSIQLEKIVASNISEADDILEVYGTVNSKLRRGNITEENIILSRAENNVINVGTSDVPLTQSFTYVVPVANVESSILEIIASFSDKDPDGNPNEFLGTRTLSFALPDIPETGQYQMTFDDDTPNVVQLTFRITQP